MRSNMRALLAAKGLLAAICLLGASPGAAKKWGPYELEITAISKCDDQGTKDILFEDPAILVTGKRSFVTSFDMTSKITIDNKVTASIEIYSFKDSDYNPIPLKYHLGPICEAMKKYLPKSYEKFYSSIGLKGCPIPPGSWKVKKFPFEAEMTLNEMFYKKHKTDIIFFEGKKRVGCTRYYFATVPEGSVKH